MHQDTCCSSCQVSGSGRVRAVLQRVATTTTTTTPEPVVPSHFLPPSIPISSPHPTSLFSFDRPGGPSSRLCVFFLLGVGCQRPRCLRGAVLQERTIHPCPQVRKRCCAMGVRVLATRICVTSWVWMNHRTGTAALLRKPRQTRPVVRRSLNTCHTVQEKWSRCSGALHHHTASNSCVGAQCLTTHPTVPGI